MMWIALLLVGSAWAQNEDSKCPFVSGPFEPPKAPPNEYYELCPKLCPTENCSALWTKIKCPPEPRCCPPPAFRCKPGYFRKNGRCVPGKECTQPTCGANEVYVDCLSCPPTNCDIAYTEYRCEPRICTPGCQCKKNYLRNDRGVCVPNDDCRPPQPICGANEEYVDCLSCPPTNCDIAYTEYLCAEPRKCTPGCQCKKNYLRRDDGVCVLNNDCPPRINCGYNEKPTTCKRSCPPQDCEAQWLNYLCSAENPCELGCVCLDNHLRNKSGTCVPIKECPPSPLIIIDPTTGTPEPPTPAILPHPDTGKEPPIAPPKCGKNEEFVQCKVECPNSYCPVDDRRGIIICDPIRPCPGGCVCKAGFRRKTLKDKRCIPAEDCPPVKCTRPNEEWNRCPRPCDGEYCQDAFITRINCDGLVNCQPKCVCKWGYYRNQSEICVPVEECPPPTTSPPDPPVTEPTGPTPVCGLNETLVDCANYLCPNFYCPKTDNGGVVPCPLPNPCPKGCMCKPQYRRQNSGDKSCILAEECPAVRCTRPNEVWNSCPKACLDESCENSDKPETVCFEKMRNCQPRCVCAKGHFRNSSNICVPASECRPKPQCGANETFVDCTFKCPHHFCPQNDDLTTYACKPGRDCPSGCGCRLGYRYRSQTDLTCVLAEDCPKPTCGANETMVSCAFKCPLVFCPSNDDLTPIACKPPPNCPPGCVCSLGYRYRSETDLTCVLAEDCPPVKCTRPNEFFNRCPIGCWTDSCEDAEQRDANGICNELVHNCQPRCYCKDRYYRNADGICVRKSKCHKCGPNQRYAQCKMACPYDYCPTDDSRDVIACDPPVDCKPGCICNVNYKLRSYTNQTCILASTCPPVKCTRPNEVWSDCPSACLLESCRDARRPQITCNTLVLNCQPRCICKENHFRNDKDICVPLNKCPLTLTEIPSEKIIPPPPGPAESEE